MNRRVRYAKVLMGFYRVEISRLTGDGWVADDVEEREIARSTMKAVVQVCDARGFRPVPAGEGCYRLQVFGPTNGPNDPRIVRFEAEATV